MAYVVKKRCVLCHKVLDAEGRCTNPDCIMSTVPTDETDEATKKAESAGQNECNNIARRFGWHSQGGTARKSC